MAFLCEVRVGPSFSYDLPLNPVCYIVSFELPDVFAEFCTVLFVSVCE